VLVAELDEVTFDLEIDGEQVRRTISRRVWERRGWATVACVYQERDREGAWKPAKLALIRLQHVREAWKKHGAITLEGPAALELAGSIEAWREHLTATDDTT
jgi:hypothetical protein